jgi:hypothetical protein
MDLEKLIHSKKTQKYYKSIVDLVSRYFPINPFPMSLNEMISRKDKKLLLENLYLLLSGKIENDNLMRCLVDLKRKTPKEKKWLKELDENVDDISKIVMCHLFYNLKLNPGSEEWKKSVQEIEEKMKKDNLTFYDYSSFDYKKKENDLKRKKTRYN